MNVGTPREIGRLRGRPVLSGIVKSPVQGPVTVKKFSLDGDGQADLSVHGGENKSVYVYPSEHYAYWRERFPDRELSWGAFGENFTTEGLLENSVCVGDRLGIGSAQFLVTQPRFPCYKLGMRFGTNEMLKWFLDSERSGFYLKVLIQGKVEAGDSITHMKGGSSRSETIRSAVREVKRKKDSGCDVSSVYGLAASLSL